MSSDFENFKEINGKVVKKEMTVEEGANACQSINFMNFDIYQIKLVQDATWLPDEFAVNILKSWIRRQDELLLQLRANLVLTPTLFKEQLLKYISAIASPSTQNESDLIVENIIEKIATSGGSQEYLNPLQYNLIFAEASNPSSKKEFDILNLFDFKETSYFVSSPSQNTSIIIGLPHFLKVKLTSYTLWGPPKLNQKAQGGPSSWALYGSNDKSNFKINLDTQASNKDLEREDAVATFKVSDPGYYRYFKFVMTGTNHINNLSIYLKRFDISGILIISKQ
ncbi:hypothetical protein GPJ56_008713 [Histomonas meleagridis]|uniref:uncharacterized protein n=1 Tax=Histomonas meleagridis TaxID=135588 RepID=UPI0035596A77|nr:hypothetical protein GPJ56_008713 [Histomonas meleagridis]KAH0803290.1 hypothetical protein GO595_004026 [Histomonas meleagridis]